MSKERLEKAKKILNHIKGYGVYDGNDDIEIFEWLIEQTERVQELEKQNKRYQKALENIVNCDGWLIEPNPFCTIEEAYERCVDEAQKALEGEKHD